MAKRELPCCEFCHYCDAPLVRRHEHDHFPIPKAAGGTEMVPACMNCHEMKDRMPLEQWNPTFLVTGLLEILGGQPQCFLSPYEIVDGVTDYKAVWPNLSHAGRLVYAKTRAAVEHHRARETRRRLTGE